MPTLMDKMETFICTQDPSKYQGAVDRYCDCIAQYIFRGFLITRGTDVMSSCYT